MREIKFRVWNKNTRKIHDVRCIDFHNQALDVMTENGCEPMKFEDCELLQYTSTKDKNEQEIYEGDIFKIEYPSHETLIKVIFKDGCFIGLKTKNNCSVDALLNRYDLKNSEIIGNIYENQFLNDKFEDLSTHELLTN